MMSRGFDRILDDCLLRMDRGESLMDILAVYPAQAEKLKPLLLVAMLSRALPQPVPGYTALRVGKNQLLAEMASMQAEDSFIKPKPARPPREGIVDRLARSLKQLQPAYRFAMLSLVVILTGGFFTFSASASGLADNIMQTLYFSFEQVGDLLLVNPSPPKAMGENPFFTSEYDLPETPPDFSGNFKSAIVEEDGKDKNIPHQLEDDVLAQIETRVYSFGQELYDEEDLVDEFADEEQLNDIDEKDLEKEEKEEEKDEDKEEKEDEKDEDKEEKEDEKTVVKDEKEDEKEEKEAEKEADKDEKEEEKDKDK